MRLRILLLLLTMVPFSLSFAQGPNGHLSGEIWFRPFIENRNLFDNVRLPGCEIAFRSKSFQKKISTDGNGHYEADLPSGIYMATTSCPMAPNNLEYYSAARSEFEVKPGASGLINLMMVAKHTIRAPGKADANIPEYRRDDLGNEFLEVRTTSKESRKILVRYARRLSSSSLAEYQGKRDYRQDTPVSLTYDTLAIYADTITIDKPAIHIHAVGHVMVEDGKQRRSGSEVTVEFDAADPIATLKLKE